MNINENDDDIPAPIAAYTDQLLGDFDDNGAPRPYPGENREDFKMRSVQHFMDTMGMTFEDALQLANNIEEAEISHMSKIKYDQQINNLMNENMFMEEQRRLKKEEFDKKMEQMPNKKDALFSKVINFMGKYRYNMGKEKKYFDLIKEAQNGIKELDNIDEYMELQDFLHNVILDDKRNKDIITYDDISEIMDNFTYVGKEDGDDDFYYGGRRKRRNTHKRRKSKSQKKRKSKTHKKRKVRKSRKSRK